MQTTSIKHHVGQLAQDTHHVDSRKALYAMMQTGVCAILESEHDKTMEDLFGAIFDQLNAVGFDATLKEEFLQLSLANFLNRDGEYVKFTQHFDHFMKMIKWKIIASYALDFVRGQDDVPSLSEIEAHVSQHIAGDALAVDEGEVRAVINLLYDQDLFHAEDQIDFSSLVEGEQGGIDFSGLVQEPKEQETDNLTQIPGVTEEVEDVFAQHDIFTYADLAGYSVEELQERFPAVSGETLQRRISDATLLRDGKGDEIVQRTSGLAGLITGVTINKEQAQATLNEFIEDMTLADIDMVRTMMVESKLAGDDLATIEQALTARITALQEINARAFSDEIQQITDPDADVSDVRQRIAESTEISLAQRGSLLQELDTHLAGLQKGKLMQQYRSEIEAFTNPDHAQTLRDGRDAGLENPEREELENLLKAKVAELVMGLYRAEIAHLTVESMNLDAGLRNRVTSDTRIEAPNKVVLIQELGARLEVLRAVAERQLTIAAIGSDQLDGLTNNIEVDNRLGAAEREGLGAMIAARRQSLQTLDTLSPEPLPTVDPRYAPYLKSLQLREMQFHNFALPDQRVRYDKKSDAGNIFVLNLLTQEVLGTNGHDGRVIKLGGAYGAVVKEPPPTIQRQKKAPPTGEKGGYVGEFTIVFLDGKVTTISVVYSTGDVYTTEGTKRKSYKKASLELGDAIYFDRLQEGQHVNHGSPTPLLSTSLPVNTLGDGEMFSNPALHILVAEKLGFTGSQQTRVQEYLCTLFAHEAFQKDFFKNYQAAYQQYTHRKSQPPNSSEIIAVCTALFDKQNISIYNTHFLAFMQKVKKLCTEADALFDDDQQAEGISARPAGQTKKQVSLDPTHKQLSIDLLPVQDYLHIYQDVLNRHHYEIDPQVVMPRAGLVLDKRLHFTNQPSVTYGQDYTVSYSSSPLQFSVTILDYTKFTFPIACTFDLEGETSYDTQQYGKITGKRVYPCFLSIESVGLDNRIFTDRFDHTITSTAIEQWYTQHVKSLVDAFAPQLRQEGDNYFLLRHQLARLFDQNYFAHRTYLCDFVKAYLLNKKKDCMDLSALDQAWRDLQKNPNQLATDENVASVRNVMTSLLLDPDWGSEDVDGDLCIDNGLYGIASDTERDFIVGSEEVKKKFFKKTVVKTNTSTPIKFGGANRSDGTIDPAEYHSNNFLYGIAHDPLKRTITTISGDAYEVTLLIPSSSAGLPFSAYNNFDVQITIASNDTPPILDTLAVQTGKELNGSCYEVRQWLMRNDRLAQFGELRNQLSCMLEESIVRHLDRTTGILMGRIGLPGVSSGLDDENMSLVRVRVDDDRGLVVEYTPDGNKTGPREVYKYQGVAFDQQTVCREDQKTLNTFLALVREVIDEQQYANKVRLFYPEPQGLVNENSDVIDFDPSAIETTFAVDALMHVGKNYGNMQKYTKIPFEQSFPLNDGTSISIGISNYTSDDEFEALKLYVVLPSGTVKEFETVGKLLGDGFMLDKFHLFVKFNDYFVKELAVTWDGIPENEGRAFMDPYTGLMIGVKRVQGQLYYGIVTNHDNPPGGDDPRNHTLLADAQFEKGTETSAKATLLSHPELFQLLWVKLFEYADPPPTYVEEAEKRAELDRKKAEDDAKQRQEKREGYDAKLRKFFGG